VSKKELWHFTETGLGFISHEEFDFESCGTAQEDAKNGPKAETKTKETNAGATDAKSSLDEAKSKPCGESLGFVVLTRHNFETKAARELWKREPFFDFFH
jgi:hypothetical protein